MQELEKILEEMKESSITVATSKEHYIHPQDGRFVEEVVLLDDIEKIIRKHMNDGWIPVEERLPDNNENVLVTTDMGLITSGYIAHGTWITDQEPDYPIAWRPLPELYKPPVESEEEKSMRGREEFFKDGE